jgi:N utilization substance protein B
VEISRHAIRECAFQTLFALASDPEIDREAIYAERLGLKPDEEVPAYLPELVNGVLAHQDELDAQIESKLAPGWTLSRLARPDLVILRLALPWLLTKPYAWHTTSAMKSHTALSMVF